MEKSNKKRDSFNLAVKEIEEVLAGKKKISDFTKASQRRVNNYVTVAPTKVKRKAAKLKMLGVEIPRRSLKKSRTST